MKSAIALLALFSTAAFAADEITVTKEKFSCATESHSKTYDASGMEISDANYSGMSSEGVRSKWVKGDVSYSFSESVAYRFTRENNGPWLNQPSAKVRTWQKTTKVEKDGLVTYTTEQRSVRMAIAARPGEEALSDKATVFVESYSLVNGEEVPHKYLHDGKEMPLWNLKTTDVRMGDRRVLVQAYDVPHREFDAEAKTTTEYLKQVYTCTYDKIAE